MAAYNNSTLTVTQILQDWDQQANKDGTRLRKLALDIFGGINGNGGPQDDSAGRPQSAPATAEAVRRTRNKCGIPNSPRSPGEDAGAASSLADSFVSNVSNSVANRENPCNMCDRWKG